MNMGTCLQYADYGTINLCIGEKMTKKNISCYEMSKLTGLRYEVVKRYLKGELYRVDLDVLARIIHVLDCEVQEILEHKL